MTEAWFIRHGETEWNQQRRIQGWTDVPLNTKGFLQAHAVGRHLQGSNIDRVLTSDLRRAVQTASVIGQYTGNQVVVDTRLRERGLGPAEGSRQTPLHDQFQKDMEGAESKAAFQKRIGSFLHELEHNTSSGAIVCVTHGGWIRSLLQSLCFHQHPSIGNASLTRLKWQGDWTVLSVADVDHLQSVNARR